MLAARGGRSEKEKDRKDRNHYKSTGLCSQRRGVGVGVEVGMEWGRGPSREERGGGKWHEPRETRPRSGHPTRPAPLPTPHPTHERDTAPLPTHITRGDTVPLPHGQTYPPWNPHGREGPPSQRSLTRRCPLRDFQALPTPETAPTQGRNGSRGPPSGESGILEPLGEKTIQRCSASFQVLEGRHPIGEMGEDQRHLFRGASETAFPWKESWPKTDLS